MNRVSRKRVSAQAHAWPETLFPVGAIAMLLTVAYPAVLAPESRGERRRDR